VIFASETVATVVLVAATLWLQSGGMTILIHWIRVWIARGTEALTAWHSAVLTVRLTTGMIVLQLLQVLLWAAFYRWKCFPTWESSFYFSAVSYSTVGYGDVILPKAWHALGPIESIVGVLMSGLSVSALFAVASRLIRDRIDPESQPVLRYPLNADAVNVKESG
jgi:voltage-gated potassium channel